MIDLVIGAAIGYGREDVRPFFKSLRLSGYGGKLVLFADKGGADEARDWDAEVRPCPKVETLPYAARFFWLCNALPGIECEGVLSADVRDVIFQANPSSLPCSGFHTFEEDQSMTIGTCPYNSLWIELGYGAAELEAMKNMPISCVGVSCGDKTSMAGYLYLLSEELQRIQPRTLKPQDQAAHNHICRRTEFTAMVWPNEEGNIYTVGYVPRETVVIADGKILNKASKAPTVVHQWDRHQNLSALVREKYL